MRFESYLLLIHLLFLVLLQRVDCSYHDYNYDRRIIHSQQDSRPPRRLYLNLTRIDQLPKRGKALYYNRLEEIAEILGRHCGRSEASGYIVGGYEPRAGEFPSYVTTATTFWNDVKQQFDLSRCGGVILSPYHILTAAHCARYDRYFGTRVLPTIDFPDLRPEALSYWPQVDTICDSPDFHKEPGTLTNLNLLDISIYKLKQPMRFNRFVQPACLPNQPLSARDIVYQIGLGKVDPYGQDPQRLQALRSRKVSCATYPKYLCVEEATEEDDLGANCPGDSGGGVMGMENGRSTVYGIINSAAGDCNKYAWQKAAAADTHYNHWDILKLIELCL